jgi:hypothetical protein
MMKNQAKFVVKFISDSVKDGKQPVDAAISEISNIDQQLHAVEDLKLRRLGLMAVLDHLGDSTYKKVYQIKVEGSDDVEPSQELDGLKEKIISAIDKNGPMTVRELIQSVASYEQDSLVLRVVKLLGEEEMITRDDNGNIQKGANWK